MRATGRIFFRNLLCVLAPVALAFGGGCDPVAPGLTITISPAALVFEDAGETVQLTATVEDQNGQAMTGVSVDWASSNGIIAQVSEDGLVTSGEGGTAAVQASVGTWTAEVFVLVEPGPRAYLHTLYRATGGDGWEDNSNWRTDAPLYHWYGVTIDTQGNIIRLDLSGNGLTGSIPAGIGSLQDLEYLSLARNGLTGSIPAELGNLQNLEYLYLYENGLTGSIPAGIGSLQDLEYLYLDENGLTGPIPAGIGSLQNLLYLDLGGNALTGPIPPELGNLQNLVHLGLDENGLTGQIPFQLDNLQNLRTLVLGGNHLTNSIPIEIGEIPMLTVLDLSRNQLTGSIPGALGRLRGLVSMNLSDNDLTGSVPRTLIGLHSLRQLSISDNPLSEPLTRYLLALRLEVFHWYNTDLCAPADESFQEWLGSIDDNRPNRNCD